MNSRNEREIEMLLGICRNAYAVVNAAYQLDVQPPGWTYQDVGELMRRLEMIVTYSEWVENYNE